MGTLEEYVSTRDFKSAILLLEREVLRGTPLLNFDFSILGSSIYSSPLILKKYGEQLFFKGELSKAKEYFSLALKGFAGQTFQEHILSTFAHLVQINLRLGHPHEVETIIQFLYAEYLEGESDQQGDVLLALALGSQLKLVKLEARPLFEQAVTMFDRQGEYHRGSLVLLEVALSEAQYMTDREWAELIAFMNQRFQVKQAKPSQYQFLCGLAEYYQGNRQQAAILFQRVEDADLPYKYKCLAQLFCFRANLAKGEYINFEQKLNYPALEHDLELKFNYLQLKFEQAYTLGQLETCTQLEHEARAVERTTRLRHQGEQIEVLKAKLDSLANKLVNIEVKGEALSQIKQLVRIKCFGGLRLELKGNEIVHLHWKRKKAQELFLYLLLQPQYKASRDQIAEALFEGTEPKKMANQLYVVTHHLKQTLNEQVSHQSVQLLTRDGVIQIHAPQLEFVDVEQYLALIKVAKRLWVHDRDLATELFEKAYQLYEPIVPEMQYVDWLDRFRDEFEEFQVEILRKLGLYAQEQGLYEQAELYFREWLALRPVDEEAYQHLLRLLIYRNKRSEAIAAYKLLERILGEELDSTPLRETRLLVFGEKP